MEDGNTTIGEPSSQRVSSILTEDLQDFLRPIFPRDSKRYRFKHRSYNNGYATYVFPHGVVYKGYFLEGEFHGLGTLVYPCGQKVRGIWKYGELISYQYVFADGVVKSDDEHGGDRVDRRFTKLMQEKLKPAGMEDITKRDKAREIPRGCYDTEVGFYNPQHNLIMSAVNPDVSLEVPGKSEAEWIVENCRKEWDEAVGYVPGFYKEWSVTGQYDAPIKKTRAG